MRGNHSVLSVLKTLGRVVLVPWDSGGGGGVLLYICLIGMCRPKGCGFRAVHGLKASVDFASFGLNSGMVFERMQERICRFNSK